MTKQPGSTGSQGPNITIKIPSSILRVCKQFAEELTLLQQEKQRAGSFAVEVDGRPATDTELKVFYNGFGAGALAGVLYALTIGSEGKMGDLHEAPDEGG